MKPLRARKSPSNKDPSRNTPLKLTSHVVVYFSIISHVVQERPLPVHKSIRKLDRERTHRRNLGYLIKGSVSALGEGLEDRVLILGLVNSNLDL
jgi:hypothetical protein